MAPGGPKSPEKLQGRGGSCGAAVTFGASGPPLARHPPADRPRPATARHPRDPLAAGHRPRPAARRPPPPAARHRPRPAAAQNLAGTGTSGVRATVAARIRNVIGRRSSG